MSGLIWLQTVRRSGGIFESFFFRENNQQTAANRQDYPACKDLIKKIFSFLVEIVEIFEHLSILCQCVIPGHCQKFIAFRV